LVRVVIDVFVALFLKKRGLSTRLSHVQSCDRKTRDYAFTLLPTDGASESAPGHIRHVRPATLDQARAAKQKLAERLHGIANVRGIGIAVLDGGYGVKVNFATRPEAGIIPDDVDGVPVVVDVVGSVRLL
jgi:hypothetical protein